MLKAAEYRQYAAECRALAEGIKNRERRDYFLKIAQTWDDLAAERERRVAPPKKVKT